jgi:hypothetical protein
MSTRKYLPREMEDFLRLLDGELGAPVCVTVIGGAAIGLEYDPRHATTDIDVTPISNDLFWNAVARARARLPDPIPVQAVGLYAAPYDYEARRRPLAIAGLDHLTVLVPEVHDLVLMKVARGLTHDLDGVEDVHRVRALDLETLVARYYDTRTQITGSPSAFQLSFLALIDRLFGAYVARKTEARLALGSPPPTGSV